MLGKPRTRTVVRTLAAAASRPSAPIPAAALTLWGFPTQSSSRGVVRRHSAYVPAELAVPGLGHADPTPTPVARTVRSAP